VQVTAGQVAQSFASDGYAVIPNLLSSLDVDDTACALSGILGDKAGTRRLLDIEWCGLLADRLVDEPRLREFLPPS
jgi:hypothetical protein